MEGHHREADAPVVNLSPVLASSEALRPQGDVVISMSSRSNIPAEVTLQDSGMQNFRAKLYLSKFSGNKDQMTREAFAKAATKALCSTPLKRDIQRSKILGSGDLLIFAKSLSAAKALISKNFLTINIQKRASWYP